MIRKSKRYLSAILTGAILLSNLSGSISISAETLSNDSNVVEVTTIENTDYEIYPAPQKIEYQDGNFNFGSSVNIIYDSGIDDYTKIRLENEILKANSIGYEVSVSKDIIEGKTNILVGIEGSGEVVDVYADKYTLSTENLFSKTDAYFLAVDNNIITILGKDTDSAFYGLTTLYHVVNQLDSNHTIRNFKVEDYANVVTRGFIEGYYGNPWSVQDRADLMTYGGYYKLNAYFYAPKDDPKHRVQWRTLYTEEELKWVKKLADAGNASKTRFVYALHPFPGGDNLGIGKNEAGYQKDLADLKAKFKQVIDQGVRQIAILADDFSNPGGALGLRLVNDITTWLQTEVKAQYPDMKDTLPYVPYDYMGNGSGVEFNDLRQAPSNVQLVQTGGRIWGEVTQSFSQTFKNNVGRPPYYWINWPCSDNSKKHLIMGGNDTFLHPGVDPTLIEGIMLNPMQQSEANKSALFAVADYSWNIWETKSQADENWYDSFKYMDHNSAIENEASTALREISKHMINQNMDSRVRALEESLELAPKLNAFKTKYESGANVKEDAQALIEEFTNIKDAADYYKNNPGNSKTRDQIIYWLNCFEDTTTAAISYLKAVISNEEGNNNEVWTNYSNAQTAFEKSKTYGFNYVDHTEYAEVGVQHIVPFIKALEGYLSPIVSGIVDPSKIVTTVITNRTDTPAGNLSNILDNNASTEVVYKNPSSIATGTYIGVKYNRVIKIKEVEFLLGAIANSADTMEEAKVQYTVDGKEWIDLEPGKVYATPNKITIEDLNLDAMGVRVIATKDRANKWFGVKDITINKSDLPKPETSINATVIRTAAWKIYSGSQANLLDGNDSSDIWYQTNTGDLTLVGDYIGLDLGAVIPVGKVRFVLGRNGSSDKWTNYRLEYSKDNSNWSTYKEYTGKTSGQDILDENLNGIEARYVRITNTKQLNKWVIFSELKVEKFGSLESTKNIYTNTDIQIKSIYQSEELTKLVPQNNITLKANDYIGIKLDRIKDLKEIALEVSNMDGLTLQTSMNEVEWINVDDTQNLKDARYIRLIASKDVTFNLSKFEVKSNEIYPISVQSSFVPINGSVANIFDKNFNTSASFSSFPVKDKSIVFNLGQTMNIKNLTYAVLDTELDYLRDAKFQVSLDGEDWTDVITIGDGIENDDSDVNSKPVDAGYIHGDSTTIVPISHAFMKGELDTPKEARYLRILFTANYISRWVRISEILINDGEYFPSVNNPTFTSNPMEVEGFTTSNIIDGNLTTAYKPNTNNGEIKSGSLTYRLSGNTDVKKINIVQGGNDISNAKVMVRTGYNESGEEVWNQIGTLSKSLNELINAKYDNIYEIKIEWEGIAPTIYEIVTINNYNVPNITDLDALVASSKDYAKESYTARSFAKFTEALDAAKSILDDLASANQDKINNAKENLSSAITELVSIEELADIINEANDIKNNGEKYTEESLGGLNMALETANVVLNNSEATKEMVSSAVDNIRNAIASLVKENQTPTEVDKTELIKLVEIINTLDESKYISSTWVVLQAELKNANIVIGDENAIEKEIAEAYNKLVKAYLDLRLTPNKSKLEDLINKAEAIDLSKYTRASVYRLNSHVANVKAVLKNEEATQEEVNKAAEGLELALASLEEKQVNNDSSNNSENKDDNKKDDNKLPSTGGTSSAALTVIALLMTGAGVVLRRKR